MAAGTLATFADNVQVVTVNGQRQAQTVTKMTFNGDNLVLNFSDGTTQTVDMASVVITFTIADAVKALATATDKDAPTLFFDLSGRQLKQAPQKGAYIMKKGDKIVKLLPR